jgi:hypothetical protein
MTLEDHAKIVAQLKHFGPNHRNEVLARRGLEEEEHAREERRWTEAIIETTSREDNSLVEAFGLAFSAEQRRLREDKPPLSSLGALPPPRALEKSAASPAHASEASPAVDAPRAAPLPATNLLAPSYLKQDSRSAPDRLAAPPAPVAPSMGDETVIGGAPTAKPLPFEGQLREPPAARPVQASPDAGGTVMVPIPEAVRAAVARLLERDPDATQLPVPNDAPVVPFSGTSSPERIREIAGPPDRTPSDDAGETVMMPAPAAARDAVLRAQNDLALREYAALRAALSVHGEDNADVLAQFKLTPASKRELQERYFDLFRTEPEVRERFEELLREETRKVNPGSR